MRKKNNFILCIILLLIVIKPALSQEGWFWQNPGPTANHMNDVIFVDDTTGWAVGDAGTLIATKDGGITWENQLVPFTYYSSLRGVDFISKTTGWVVGRLGTILKTTNGGNNWFIQQINKPYTLYDVDFISETSLNLDYVKALVFGLKDGNFVFLNEGSDFSVSDLQQYNTLEERICP